MYIKIISFVCLFLLALSSYAQNNETLTYTAKDKTIVEILKDIEKISPYRFSYNNNIFNNQKIKEISLSQATIDVCMNKLLSEKHTYTVIGKQVVITEKTPTEKPIVTTKKIEPKNDKKIVYETIPIYDTITVYDTLYRYVTIKDTITVHDTVEHIKTINVQHYETNFLHTNNKTFSFALQTSLLYNNSHFFNKDDYAKQLQNTHSNTLGYDLQINATYKRNNILFQSGIGFQDRRIGSSFAITSYTDDPTKTYTDTLWYWKFNELFTYYKFNSSGDSVAITVLDSTWTYSLKENPKKIEHNMDKSSTISYKYIYIPIGVGFNYNVNQTLAIQPFIACNALFLTSCHGEIPDETFTKTIAVKDIVRQFNISGTLSCSIVYSPQQHFSIYLQPIYSIIPSIYRNEKINCSATISSFGLGWGLSYTIPSNGK